MYSSRMRTTSSLPYRGDLRPKSWSLSSGVSVHGVSVPGRNMGPETETSSLEGTWDQRQRLPPQKEHGTRVRDPWKERKMGLGSQTGSDIKQRHPPVN